jgi:hypothetical protein
MYMSLKACCCSNSLRFNLYCFLYSAFFCFLTASVLISAILVTRSAWATLDSFCFFFYCMTSRTRYGVCSVSKVIRNNREVRHIHVNKHQALWRGPCNTQRQARELISGPDLAMGARLLSFNRTQTGVVTGLLTGHNTLRRHLLIMGLCNDPMCRKCVTEEETSVHI